jgi:hypothetical protein
MQANKATGIVVFIQGVQLLHLPAEDPDVPVDPDNLPEGGMWMRCHKLRGLNRKLDDKTSTNEFEATGRVFVRAREFSAQADFVKYDQSKELLILEGEGSNARLWRQTRPGLEPQKTEAKRIWYWRNTNTIRFDETDSIRP